MKKAVLFEERKIFTLAEVEQLVKTEKNAGRKVGLVTGCFDVLHFGHVEFLRRAKKKTDFLVVGVENDATVGNWKGEGRPVNRLKWRLEMLAEMVSVDLVFPIEIVFGKDGLERTREGYEKIYSQIGPDWLVTNLGADRFWREKKKIAARLGIRFYGQRKVKPVSSTEILEKIG